MNYTSIDMKKTGENIYNLREKHQLSVKDLQEIFGFSSPQAIYKWQYGLTVPSIDNLLILSEIFHVPIDEIVIRTDTKLINQPLTDYGKISILIPVLQTEKYIKRCLDSVLQQDYPNMEIIVIDGGSTDNTPLILGQYAQDFSNIRYISMKQANLPAVRNALVKESTGDYIFFLDSDDFLVPHAIKLLYHTAITQNAEIVQCEMERTCQDHITDHPNYGIELYSKEEALSAYNRTMEGPRCMTAGKLYKKTVFQNISFPENRKTQECEFVTPLLINQCNRFVCIRRKLYGYYHNPASIMHKKFSLEQLEVLPAIQESIAFYQQKQMTAQVNRIRFRYLTLLRILYEKTITFYPKETEIHSFLICEYAKNLPLVIETLDLSEDMKQDFIQWGKQPLSTSSYGYWFYVANQILPE